MCLIQNLIIMILVWQRFAKLHAKLFKLIILALLANSIYIASLTIQHSIFEDNLRTYYFLESITVLSVTLACFLFANVFYVVFHNHVSIKRNLVFAMLFALQTSLISGRISLILVDDLAEHRDDLVIMKNVMLVVLFISLTSAFILIYLDILTNQQSSHSVVVNLQFRHFSISSIMAVILSVTLVYLLYNDDYLPMIPLISNLIFIFVLGIYTFIRYEKLTIYFPKSYFFVMIFNPDHNLIFFDDLTQIREKFEDLFLAGNLFQAISQISNEFYDEVVRPKEIIIEDHYIHFNWSEQYYSVILTDEKTDLIEIAMSNLHNSMDDLLLITKSNNSNPMLELTLEIKENVERHFFFVNRL